MKNRIPLFLLTAIRPATVNRPAAGNRHGWAPVNHAAETF